MRILSYVRARYEDGSFTGVSRFDYELRRVFPDLVSVAELPAALDPERDLVITDNHLSLDVPAAVKTIVVHQGSAKAHYDRDPQWRTPATAAMVEAQRLMFLNQNRLYVAPSLWVKKQFEDHHAKTLYIPHHVDTFGPARRKPIRNPIVIGDWRDFNKGADVIRRVAGKLKAVEFRKLNFPPTKEAREKFYLDADAYLCLSLSEGAPYAVADAEACGLRVITTDVGLVHELKGATVIPWGKRDDPDVVIYAVKKALSAERRQPSFYASQGLDKWTSEWRRAVSEFWDPSTIEVSSGIPEPSADAAQVKSVAVSLAGGIGNAVFNLPLLSALKNMGKYVVACVGTDSPTSELWKSCCYIDLVVEKVSDLPRVDARLSGPWCMEGFRPSPGMHAKWDEKIHHKPEWELILELASKLGWTGGKPATFGWHLKVNLIPLRHRRWDIVIVPGCKPEKLWERKRYPYMVQVAKRLVEELGYKVGWIGEESDRPETSEPLPGEDFFGKFKITDLPFALADAGVVLGTDSGPTHLASSLGVAVAAVYTATSPVKGEPVGRRFEKIYRALACSPCQSIPRWKKCEDWICREISPEAVFSATVNLLEEERGCDA